MTMFRLMTSELQGPACTQGFYKGAWSHLGGTPSMSHGIWAQLLSAHWDS